MELRCVIVLVLFLLQEFMTSFAAIRVPSGKVPLVSQKRDADPRETTAEYWHDIAQQFLHKAKTKKPITNIAKNVILFLGDGMSVPTVTAARIYAGGESSLLSFERFPYTAVSKTYSVDRQVSESTCTATAYLGGVKGNWYTSGLTGAVKNGDCEGSLLPENQVSSIAEWSQKKYKWTGFVTTTRITHASPAALYSHTAHKYWESDADVESDGKTSDHCPDIAKQLIHGEVGKRFRVILGGGRSKFLPKETIDEQGIPGHRLDKKNLVEDWKDMNEKYHNKYEYVWNRKQLLDVKNETEYLFGLFHHDFCKYNVDRDPEMDPTLEEMTEAAIRKLEKSPEGYFLFVEGGMIDQAHHVNRAGKALDETEQFSKAIDRAVRMTDEKDTLIVVTADHSHTMIIGGYPKRGSNILGVTDYSDVFPINRSLPTISYTNGPGRRPSASHNFSEDTIDMNYQYPVLYETSIETHGGDDVLIYARGPWAHLFEGVMEQNAIPHLMAYASCVGDRSTSCKDGANVAGSSNSRILNSLTIAFSFITYITFSPIIYLCCI